jgi:hypothetical protein
MMQNRMILGLRRKAFQSGLLTLLLSAALILILIACAFRYSALREIASLADAPLPSCLFVLSILASARSAIAKRRPKGQPAPKNPKSLPACLRVLIPGLAVAAFLVPVFHTWSESPSEPGNQYILIGGLVPYSDAEGYYRGAQELILNGRLDNFNCRRPLNPALLAVRLSLVGHDFRLALILQALMLGIACYWASARLAGDWGGPAGLAFFALLLAFGRLQVATTLTESLGLTLGVLAFTTLWGAARKRSAWSACVGLFLLTSALNARAGAFLVLPMAVLWAGLALPRSRRMKATMAALALASVLAGFLFNASIVKTYEGRGVMHASFAWVLYGLSAGGRGWRAVQEDFPQIGVADTPEEARFIYGRAFENIAKAPARFASVLMRLAFRSLVTMAWDVTNLVKGTGQAPLRVPRTPFQTAELAGSIVILLLLSAAAVRALLLNGTEPHLSLLAAGLGGLALSMPVIYPDGGLRVTAATFPFVAAALAGAAALWDTRLPDEPDVARRAPGGLPAWAGLLLLFAALVGPAIAHGWTARPEAGRLPPVADNSLVTVIGPGSPHINVHPESLAAGNFAPDWEEKEFFSSPLFGGVEYPGAALALRAPSTLLLCYDVRGGPLSPAYLVGPLGFADQERGPVAMESAPIAGTPFRRVVQMQPLIPRAVLP